MTDIAGGDAERAFLIRRPFEWGILILHNGTSIPEMPNPWTPGTIVADDHGLILPVHHAQDVEYDDLPDDAIVPYFEVEVECFVGGPANRSVAFEGILAVPDGRLWIGDAGGDYVLSLLAGPKLLQVAIDPPDIGDRVTIWVSDSP